MLVDEPALKPTAHIFVDSKAPWHEIRDDLPQHDEYEVLIGCTALAAVWRGR